MLVDEWVETLWKILQVRPKTIHDYKRLYKRHLKPLIGASELDALPIQDLQKKLLSLPPQTARHCLLYFLRSTKFPYLFINSDVLVKIP